MRWIASLVLLPAAIAVALAKDFSKVQIKVEKVAGEGKADDLALAIAQHLVGGGHALQKHVALRVGRAR